MRHNVSNLTATNTLIVVQAIMTELPVAIVEINKVPKAWADKECYC